MTIELIEKATDSSSFMERLMAALTEAIETDTDMAITVSMLHRTQDDQENVESIIEYSLSGYDNMTHEQRINLSQVLDLMGHIAHTVGGTTAIPGFSLSQIEYIMQNVFEKDMLDAEQMQQLCGRVFEKAEFRGIGSQLRFMVNGSRSAEVTLIVTAEIYADTSILELEQATALGVAHLHTPSASDRVVPIMSMTASSLDFL